MPLSPAWRPSGSAAAGVVDVIADSEDDIHEVVDVSSDEDGVQVRAGAPPVRFHGYRRGRELGRGATGKVFVCSKKGCAGGLAVKTVDLRRMQLSANAQRELTSLSREVSILKTLPPHPNIVRLIDAFEEGDWFLLVLELVGGGDLFTALTARDPARLLEQESAFVFLQLVDGLSFLHQRNVIHRDVKLENVLVASERREPPLVLYGVKITDFGLSKVVGSGVSEARSLVGTRPYTAPEVVWGGSYDFRSDLWCLGVLLYVLLAGHFPFDTIPGQQAELDRIAEGLRVSAAASSMVSGLLRLEPEQRISLHGVRGHAWFQDDGESPERQPKRPRAAAEAPSGAPPAEPRRSLGHQLPLHAPGRPPAAGAAAPAAAGALAGGQAAPAAQEKVAPLLPDRAIEHTYQASGIGEWLAHLYNASRQRQRAGEHAAVGGAAGGAAPPPAADDAGLWCGGPANPPDVMQLFIVVPADLAAAVLGKAGAQITKEAITIGCRAKVACREGIGSHLLVLAGTYNQCAIVQELLHNRLMEQMRRAGREASDLVEVALFIRAEAAGVVIGKQGFVLNQIRKQSGARIHLLTEQLRGQRPCLLTGSLQGVLRAERHVFHLVRAVPVVTSVPEFAPVAWASPPLSPPLPWGSPFPATPLPSPAPSDA